MKKSLLTLFLFSFLIVGYSQCDLNGTLSVFGSNGEQTGHTVVQSTDGGYFFIGLSVNNGTKIMVVKTDENLVKQWAKTYGTSNVVEGQAVVATSDGLGGCVFSGYELMSFRNAICVRIDPNGNVIWSKELPASSHDTPRDIFRTSDGLFVLCGTTNSYGSGASDAFVQVFDIDGSSLWSKTIGNSGNEHFYSGMQNLAGNYVFGGHSDYSLSGRQSWMVEMTPAGDVIRDVVLSDGGNAYISDMCQDASGFYYLTGCQFNNGNADSWVAKYDSNYQSVWSKEITSSGADRGLSVNLNNESDVVFTTISDAIGTLSSLLITRLDSTSGDFISNSAIDYSGNEMTHILAKNSVMRSDDRIIVYGGTSSYGNGNENIICMTDPCLMNECINTQSITLGTWNLLSGDAVHNEIAIGDFFDFTLVVQELSLTDLQNSDMCVYQGVSELEMEKEISVYPNPTSGNLTMNVSVNGLKIYKIYGLDGQLIGTGQFASFSNTIDVSELSSGVYFLQIIGTEAMRSVRFEKF